jgi:hypothetical protein
MAAVTIVMWVLMVRSNVEPGGNYDRWFGVGIVNGSNPARFRTARLDLVGIVETTRVEIISFKAITEDMAQDYGEGERTVDWWRSPLSSFRKPSRRGTFCIFEKVCVKFCVS